MTTRITTNDPISRHAALRRWARRHPRGVVSVVAMMFLILFGSLAAAMAITSRGNITTAATHQHMVRAMGAAETGLAVAEQRLSEAASRLIVERGSVDPGFGQRLWTGSFNPGDGQVDVLPPISYPGAAGSVAGLADAIREIHDQDINTIAVNGIVTNILAPNPTADPTVYGPGPWVRTKAVALGDQPGPEPRGVAFQIDYAPLASGTDVRVIVTGYDFDYQTRQRPVTRRIIQDYSIVKRVNAAVLSPSKIMIGKNVMIHGDLGAVYTDVGETLGDPLVMKSDFWGLDPALDAELTKLFNALASYDTDKDNRLRIGHPIEGPGIPDYSNLGYPGDAADVTGNSFVDEFDVFIMYYDANRDGRVALTAAAAAGTPGSGLAPELVANGLPVDDDLSILIDSATPDRNRNGVWSYVDQNANGRFDPGVDTLDDVEEVVPANVPPDLQSYIFTSGGRSYINRDQILGFRDGVIDRRDQYAKVNGRLVFRVTESQWIAGQGDYMTKLRGPVDPRREGIAPMQFGASTNQLPDINVANFTNSQNALRAAADGDGKTFDEQVAVNLGIAPGALSTWTPANNPPAPGAPKYYPLLPDTNHDALPDNWQTAHFEKMPFNSPSYSDWYYRPVYENMIFHNVEIPQGNNALFRNCQFIGVTFVRSTPSNGHINWSLYGKLKMDSSVGRPVPDPSRVEYTGTSFPQMLDSGDRPVLMATTPLDKADIPHDQIPFTIGYSSLPDPLLINGLRCIDTKKVSNNIRFHDCLFVGSIVSDAPTVYTHGRNKLQFTGGTRFVQQHPQHPSTPYYNPDPADMPEIVKSSMMLPNYSVDIGNFNSPPTQDVQLRGVIIAGVLDVRGNADIEGALLLTFKPVMGQIPLRDALGQPIGNPALFNATLGYFGPADGDDESLDPATLPILNGVKIVGWDLDSDGLPDLGPNQPPTPAQVAAGAVAVPFHGYGKVSFRFDPAMALPDGILLPLQVDPQRSTYKETAK